MSDEEVALEEFKEYAHEYEEETNSDPEDRDYGI